MSDLNPNIRVSVDLELVVPDAKPDGIIGVDDRTNSLIDDRIHEILEAGDSGDFIYTAVVGEPKLID